MTAIRKEPALLIEANELSIHTEGKTLLNNISFKCYSGEAWAITGLSGSGKTLLGKILAGHLAPSSGQLLLHLPPSSTRIMISQQHDFRDNSQRGYYQQRFDSNYGAESPLVIEELRRAWKAEGSSPNFEEAVSETANNLRISHLLHSRLIELSNGEGKRVQLARALLQYPRLIVFDNPFLGLDAEARKTLHDIIRHLRETGIIIFVITSPREIPESVNRIMELNGGKVKGIFTPEAFRKISAPEAGKRESPALPTLHIWKESDYDFTVAVEMRNVNVSYGEKEILRNVDWKVLKGEQWALLGPNGSGKSTLLSLINGDNPKAYSNDIWLFDQKKGSGESIWEIKRKIGYISPELHIYFERNPSFTEVLAVSATGSELPDGTRRGTTVFETVASGLNDQVGSSGKITTFQKQQIRLWMEILEIISYANLPLHRLSLGNQRLALLGRALVKNPPVLILDEPCQGLDKEQTHRFTGIVDSICLHYGKTLIYVSHYMDELPSCIRRFLFLEEGKVKEVVVKE